MIISYLIQSNPSIYLSCILLTIPSIYLPVFQSSFSIIVIFSTVASSSEPPSSSRSMQRDQSFVDRYKRFCTKSSPTQSRWETGEKRLTKSAAKSLPFWNVHQMRHFKRTPLSSRKNWGHWWEGRRKEVLYRCLWKTHRSTANPPCPPWGLQPSSVLLLVWLPAATALGHHRGKNRHTSTFAFRNHLTSINRIWYGMIWWQTTSFIIFLPTKEPECRNNRTTAIFRLHLAFKASSYSRWRSSISIHSHQTSSKR